MKIGGITPITMIDYPDKLACVVFFQGCPLRCRFCHNKQLLDFAKQAEYTEEYLYSFLKERQGFLDAVVLSGGEPYAQKGLIELMQYAKSLNYFVGIHTSGYYYDNLISSFPFVDWIGLDIKCHFEDYPKLTFVNCGATVAKSLNAVLSSRVSYEIRTTVDPSYFDAVKLLSLAKVLHNLKVKNFVIQEYRPITKEEDRVKLSDIISDATISQIHAMFENFIVRYS